MWLTIGEQRLAITLDDSETSWALAQQLPFTLEMTNLNASVKHAGLSQRLPARLVRPGTIRMAT
ncbi:cyclophilin-like fold protein [Pseudomonas wadenswilerensis]|uniref:cyclophilin-like fold protein n=1 Tax=Pseudomonas wadenswilerensis TaxID=1785161 RepID=UPI00215F99DE|nr:cyclophilin-like fold protein [Pseudomonas wadenswilerensis]UVM20138.1 hypothetical protein LOY45_16940 [Pseudomonas wadenswilerensis]